MKFTNLLMSWGAQLVLEQSVRKLNLTDLIVQLEQSGKTITNRLKICPNTAPNRQLLCHLIGIERWGQRRLWVFLGEPYLSEEYDHYRPSAERPWEDLCVEWDTTRQNTLGLINELTPASPVKIDKVAHNQFGSLSIKAWLRYLDIHASGEGKRIK